MLKLYSYRRCPFAIRARLVLHEKGLEFEIIEESLRNMSEDLKRLHPEARVPLLLHDDHVVYESCIITEYLDDQFPQKPLMPTDALKRMQVREWTYWCNTAFKPDIDAYKYGPGKLSDEEVQAATKRVDSHVRRIDARLAENEWLVGSAFSLADIHVFPFFRQLDRVSLRHPALDECQHAKQWFQKIQDRPSYAKSMAK